MSVTLFWWFLADMFVRGAEVHTGLARVARVCTQVGCTGRTGLHGFTRVEPRVGRGRIVWVSMTHDLTNSNSGAQRGHSLPYPK